MLRVEPGFRIKRVEMRDPAGEEEEDKLFGFRWKMGCLWRERVSSAQNRGARELRIKAKAARGQRRAAATKELTSR